MRLSFVGLLLLLAAPSLAAAQNESPDRANWGEWARAFSAYADHPSSSNADALRRALLPSPQGNTPGMPPTYDSVVSWLAVLDRRVKATDPVAVRLAFEIEPSMGGGEVSETLDIMLGELIRIDPRLFLAELRAQEERQRNVGVPGANLGPEFVDDFQGQCHELVLRLASLQGVSDSLLAAVKQRAIRSLYASAQGRCRY